MKLEFEVSNNKKYKIDGIYDSAVYARESVGQLPGLYYLILQKDYSEEKNTWEPISAIQHPQKLIIAYYKDNPKS